MLNNLEQIPLSMKSRANAKYSVGSIPTTEELVVTFLSFYTGYLFKVKNT